MQGVVSYPGVANPIRGSYTLTIGTQPSVVSLDCLPQGAIPGENGTVAFRFGDVVIPLVDCKLDTAKSSLDDAAEWSLALLDGRWRWHWRQISGEYNVREPGSETAAARYKPGSERTPQQLAVLLMQALNVSAYDVSRLPNGTRPHVQWDRSSAANELETLCEELGCAPVWNPFTNAVVIQRLGVDGLPGLPDHLTLASADVTINPAEAPDWIRLVCAETWIQTRWRLEAVGKDTDGSVKPLAELSYTPSDGWQSEPWHFPNVELQHGDEAQRFAEETVWRWYRIAPHLEPVTVPFPLSDPALPNAVASYVVNDLEQILPVQSHQTVTLDASDDSGRKYEGPRVTGSYYLENLGTPQNSDDEDLSASHPDGIVYRGGFQVDGSRGLVKFKQQVKRHTGSETAPWDPATLWIELAVPLRDVNAAGEGTRGVLRHEFYQPTPGSARGNGYEVVRRDEIRLLVREHFSLGSGIVGHEPGASAGWNDNLADIQPEIEYHAQAAAAKWQPVTGANGVYNGLLPLAVDGRIRQVSWSVDADGGAETRAALNTEIDPYTPPYREKRERQKQRSALDDKKAEFRRIADQLREDAAGRDLGAEVEGEA